MAAKCYAPVFTGTNIWACVYLTLVYAIIIIFLVASLIWLTAEGRCLIRQYRFRIQHCRDGNSDPNRLI